MIILSCKNIHKSYGTDIILNDINLNLNEGEKVGLIGPNGAGKSTLFKIITGQLEEDLGNLFIDKNKSIGYLSQHLSLESSNSIYDEMLTVFRELLKLEKKLSTLENIMNQPYNDNNKKQYDKAIKDYTTYTEIYNNKGGYTYKAEIGKVLSGLGFNQDDYDKNISILSGGQKTRIALCKLLLVKPQILLLDEPTNHLDLDAIEWLEDYLKMYKGTVLIISHDRYFLDAITSKTLELINGHINSYNGNYTQYIDLKKKNYDTQLKAYNLQQTEIKRQEEIIKRFKSFNREKSIKAAESRQKALDKIERIEQPDKEQKIDHIIFETQIKSGNDVLHIENLSKKFNKVLFQNLDLDIKRGERTAIIGENGRGKTTLFKIIMDKLKADSGTCSIGKNVFIGYYDQEQSNLNLNKTVLDEVWDDFPELTTTEIRSYLAAFLFQNDDILKKVSDLSGGEKCRINLLKLMLSKSNFLLLDEPTNHLDIMSREALEDALFNYDGTVLVISHDRYFLNKVINKIYELTENGANEYLGNYSYYIEKKENPLRFKKDNSELSEKTKTQINNEKKKKREIKKLEKEQKLKIQNLEDSISNIENLILKLQDDLCREDIYSDPQKSETINKMLIEKQSKLDSLYEKWEKLM
ncbi:ABC transporter ATP-binding protein [Clostridium fermenticellae]|uniref:ABC transporter ATP-binding protein n=1 Tax=Clostridium fermenticellae TaxID=2068654 RepID=A0A386H1Q3_9CLOT|nr:ABC-F family ATP-binding cassette domain-containing protein [Clostridium fermenticellae]AYD39475.1 ABC transporter ATP-binding protein [Clostridium fermenticellae]